MHERKAKMTELADAFLALPGGIGTLDELFEAWSWNALGYHKKPFCLLNVEGYWDGLIEFIDHATQSGFMSAAAARAALVATTPEQALELLDEAAGSRYAGHGLVEFSAPGGGALHESASCSASPGSL